MSKSVALANQFLDEVFGSGTPATIYVALFVGASEVTGGSYARVAVTNNGTQWPAASGGNKTPANDIVFAVSTAPWGTPTVVKLMDASSGGNVLYSDSITSPQGVNTGDTYMFLAGALIVEER